MASVTIRLQFEMELHSLAFLFVVLVNHRSQNGQKEFILFI